MRKKRKEETSSNIWRSYSDMMAGILLLFVLIMCVMMFQAQVSYNEALKEKDEKIALSEEYNAQLLAQQQELDEQSEKLSTQDSQLAEQAEELSARDLMLAELAAQLEEKESLLATQESLLAAQQSDLDEQSALIATQQQKIDQILGVKSEVVASLKNEFEAQNVNVDIDSTGALIMDANVMFDYDDANLTEEGKAALDQILPIYCKVLLDEQYKGYLAEIIIDGYTDPEGDYAYNLELSQRRSLAVAEYLLETEDRFLKENEIADLEQYLTVNGHSEAHAITGADGQIDPDACRRVEIKFRLKDDEMMANLSEIMSGESGKETEAETKSGKKKQ